MFIFLPNAKTSWISLSCLILSLILFTISLPAKEIEYRADQIFHAHEKIKMKLTAYSAKDSCHYPGCKMASGKKAYIGAAACPRNWKLGTKVMINGKEYICEDRYNPGFTDRVDIFTGYGEKAYKQAKEHGVQIAEVLILQR